MNRIYNSLSLKFLKKFLQIIKNLKSDAFLFIAFTLLYFLIWIVNPGNYVILATFIVFFIILYFKLRDLRLSLLLTYLASSLISVGKTYVVQLIPPGIYDPEVFPNGYLLPVVITPGQVFSVVMLLLLIRDMVKGKLSSRIFSTKNLILVLFFVWLFISDSQSRQPQVSLTFSLLGTGGMILYFYLQSYIKEINKFLPLLSWF